MHSNVKKPCIHNFSSEFWIRRREEREVTVWNTYQFYQHDKVIVPLFQNLYFAYKELTSYAFWNCPLEIFTLWANKMNKSYDFCKVGGWIFQRIEVN